MRGCLRAYVVAWVRYAACLLHETPTIRSGGFVW